MIRFARVKVIQLSFFLRCQFAARVDSRRMLPAPADSSHLPGCSVRATPPLLGVFWRRCIVYCVLHYS